ncbi:hypothetical protein [Metabacillus litoralis]|uniref:hypothetical protein n=1 Tax=Metabacillus litoralis TaxID=152268 RepID=UPI00203BE1E8|nr:hypothetical protein [Metabacillus litoralis]MCM3163735.1 hypothetical protein [Metabacillus litoralis]
MLNYKDHSSFSLFNKELRDLVKKRNTLDSAQFEHQLNQLFDKDIPEVVLTPNKELRDIYPRYELIEEPVTYNRMLNLDIIIGHNVSSSRERIYSNISRVRRAIPYIIEGDKKAIDVHKIGEDYYISDGKHRFYAHILLGENKIYAEVKEYNYSDFLSSHTLVKQGSEYLLIPNDKLINHNVQVVFNKEFSPIKVLKEKEVEALRKLNINLIELDKLNMYEENKVKLSIWDRLKKIIFGK